MWGAHLHNTGRHRLLETCPVVVTMQNTSHRNTKRCICTCVIIILYMWFVHVLCLAVCLLHSSFLLHLYLTCTIYTLYLLPISIHTCIYMYVQCRYGTCITLHIHVHVTINSLQVNSWFEIIKLQKFQTLHCPYILYVAICYTVYKCAHCMLLSTSV